MKKLVISVVAATLFLSCQSEYQNSIEKFVTKRAMGVDLKYQSKKIEVIDKVTVARSIADWNRINKTDAPIKDQIGKVEELVKYKRENNVDNLNVWEYKLSRIKQLAKMSPNDIDYIVLKNEYTIVNPVLNNAHQTLSAYFFVNYAGEVIAKETDEGFANDGDYKYADTKEMKYEMAMLKNGF